MNFNKNIVSRVPAFLIFTILILSCRQEPFEGIHGEGVVEYDIIYKKNNLKSGIPEAYLPKKMKLTFSNRYTKNTIEGYAGIISIKNINDLMIDTVTTSIKFFNHKYFFTSKPKEIPCCFEILEKPEIEFLNDSTTIAGLNCYKARVRFPSKGDSHEIFYTTEINDKIINKNTAYDQIPGILMDFETEMGSLTMRFLATKVEFKKVEQEEFQLPKGYKHQTKDNMIKIINQLLE